MYRVNFTCWKTSSNDYKKKLDCTDVIAYWYEEVSSDMEALKAAARIAWNQNKGPKRFKLSQIVDGGQDILIEEHNL